LVEAIKGKWEPPASYLKARASEERRREDEKRRNLRAKLESEEEARVELDRATTSTLLSSLDEEKREAVLAKARERVAEKSAAVAERPESRAFDAMCKEELREVLVGEYPEEFEKLRQRISRETRIDLNDDL
jgi:hypothetical protein